MLTQTLEAMPPPYYVLTAINEWTLLQGDGKVVFNDGFVCNTVKWYPGYPSTAAEANNIVFNISPQGENGFMNIEEYTYNAPLCQLKFNLSKSFV